MNTRAPITVTSAVFRWGSCSTACECTSTSGLYSPLLKTIEFPGQSFRVRRSAFGYAEELSAYKCSELHVRENTDEQTCKAVANCDGLLVCRRAGRLAAKHAGPE